MTDQNLLFFTQIGNCYQVPVAQLEESFRPRDRGTMLAGILSGLEDGEQVVSVILMPEDTGRLGDGKTALATVTLAGRGEPLAAVALEGTGITAIADAEGWFELPGVSLAEDENVLTVIATDAADVETLLRLIQ